MKRLLILLFFLVGGMAAKAQFSNTDTLRAFINRWIRNSAVEAFQNLRMNTALIGMTNFLDSSYGGQIKSIAAVTDTSFRVITVGNDTIFVNIPGKATQLTDSTFRVGNDTIIVRGTAPDLQQVLAKGSTITSNFTITLADSLKFTSGKVIVTDSVKMSGLPSSSDSTNKPVVIDANGNMKKMTYWPGSGADTTTINQLITDSIAAHPQTIFDTALYTSGGSLDTITLTKIIGKDPISIESHPYNLNIAKTYPPDVNEAWINNTTGGIKFGTAISTSQTISVIYKYQPVVPFTTIIADLQFVVTASGGTINNGDANFTISSLIGKRIRFFRGQLLQPNSNTGGSYYTFNSTTGEITISPAATTGELIQIETY